MKKERKEAIMRIIVGIISGIILEVWGIVVKVLGIINWFIQLFKAKRNRRLAKFCEPWNTEMYKYLRYMTAMSNHRPFPFSSIERMSQFH